MAEDRRSLWLTARDWFFTIPALLAIAATLGVFDVIGRLALFFGLRPFEWVMAAMQRALLASFSLAGVRVKVEGREHVDPNRGYVLVSNHQGIFDIPLFGGVLLRNFPKYVAKRGLGKGIPAVSLNLRRGGNALIRRDDRGQATREISRVGAEAASRGVSVVIFPEGRRSRDGRLGAFRTAGAEALLRSAPEHLVVPVAIDGSWRITRYGLRPIPFGSGVKIRFGEPFEREPDESGAAIVEACRVFIADALEGWRTAGV